MSDFLSEFHAAMSAAGFEPRGGKIVADDKWHQATYIGDKKDKFSGTYTMKIVSADFAIGTFFTRKDPDNKHKWHSKSNKKMTPEERRRLKKEHEDQQRLKEVADDLRYRRISHWLTKIYNALPKAPDDHPYLLRKGVCAHGLRLRKKGNELIIPLRGADGKIWSIQKITTRGGKYLFRGGRKQGSYFAFASSKEDLSVLILCEGYATGASIREATGKPVIAAIDSGNLKPVLIALKKKYPNSRFLICADDDAFTVNAKQEPWNVGREKANEAAAAVGNATVCFPVFYDGQEAARNKWTDYNDLHAAEGLEKVTEQIEEALNRILAPSDLAPHSLGNADPSAQDEAPASGENLSELSQHIGGGDIPPPEQDERDNAPQPVEKTANENWQVGMMFDGKGNLIKTSLKNKLLLLNNHDRYRGIYKYNDFAHKIMIVRCPPWEAEAAFRVRQVTDVDITQTAAALEDMGVTPDRNQVHKAIESVAYSNKFHPARDYFNALEWDGVHRLEKWLTFYLGAEDDDPEYLAFVGKKWLTAAVKRIFEPGCKFDHVLVIEGEQGRGKSTALKVLSTFGDDVEESYFTDAITIAHLQDKDTTQKIQGSVIVELAELAGFNKKDDEEIKRWITLQHDDCRLPYAITTTRFKRQFVLSATTNSYDYLKDPTGNRRYWPMKSSAIDLEAIRRDRKQLWAEAVHCYKNGLYIGLTRSEMALAEAAQRKRRAVDIWEDDVLKVIEKLSELPRPLKVDEIMKEMGIVLRDRDYKSQRRIIGILQSNGYENIVGKTGGKSIRGWKKVNEGQEIEF